MQIDIANKEQIRNTFICSVQSAKSAKATN